MPSIHVGDKVPHFVNMAMIESEFKVVSLNDYEGKYIVMLFYSLDFTFVSPTEIVAFNDRLTDMDEMGVKVIAISTDSHYTHYAWSETARENGGLGQLDLVLVSDKTHTMCRDYGVLNEKEGIAYPTLFIVDDKGIVRQVLAHDPAIGCNIDDVIRLIKACKYADEHHAVCPAGWTPGDEAIKPNARESKAYFDQLYGKK